MRFHTLRQLKEFDTITLETPINLIKVGNDPVGNMEFLPHIVVKFKMEFTLMNLGYVLIYAYINEDNSTIELAFYRDYQFHSIAIVELKKFGETENPNDINYIINDYISNEFKGFELDKLAKSTLSYTLDAMAYIKQTLAKRETIVKTERKKRVSKAGANAPVTTLPTNTKRKATVLNNNKVIYSISTSEKSFNHIRKYNKYKGSFSVIGHTRKLKSGKTTWVKTYIKGDGPRIKKDYIIK